MHAELWERQPRETAKAYEAFCVYRDLGPNRSLRRAAQKLEKSLSLIERWSKRWGWQERLRQMQIYQDRLDQKALAERRRRARIRKMRIAQAGQNIVIKRLDALLEKLKEGEEGGLAPQSLPTWARTFTAIEAEALEDVPEDDGSLDEPDDFA